MLCVSCACVSATCSSYALRHKQLMLNNSNPEACIILSLLYQFAMGTVLMSLLTGRRGLRQEAKAPVGVAEEHAVCG